jgi:hypothetical protein
LLFAALTGDAATFTLAVTRVSAGAGDALLPLVTMLVLTRYSAILASAASNPRMTAL